MENVQKLADREEIARLAALSPVEYDRVREAEAEKLGVRVTILDAEVKKEQSVGIEANDMAALFPDVEPWPHAVDGAALLGEIYDTIKRFIICENETARTAALWIIFTWFIDHVQVAPLAIITAPEKRCGKSQLLSLMGSLSRRPLVASNISAAAIFRVVEGYSPTLLIDEADSFLRENEEARGIINSGHTRQSAHVIRLVGDDHEPRRFTTWGAKVICGIGTLPETLMDRAVVLELRRKLPDEKAERLRHADQGFFKTINRKLARFVEDAGAAIAEARPALPDALNDRAQDNWEPLLAIADHAGGEWPQRAREAALKLSGAAQDAVSLSAELLADIREIFDGSRKLASRISTADLLRELNNDDLKPWATYNRGKPMTPRQLAKRLADYGIKSEVIRIGVTTPRGFLREWFEDAFTRYLPHPDTSLEKPATVQQTHLSHSTEPFSHVADDLQRCGTETVSATPNSLEKLGCCAVADKSGNNDIVQITA